jgi:hypothetical protein
MWPTNAQRRLGEGGLLLLPVPRKCFEQFSEDCLYSNVWTPQPARSRRLPVMVWFHGGGNQLLSASAIFLGNLAPQFNGRVLA